MAWNKDEMCKQAAKEFFNGAYANLGIGMPTLVADHIPEDVKVIFQSENGMLGMGGFPTEKEIDADLINAGKQTITELPYSSYFGSEESFAMIRGGHIDITVLGALEVSEDGDLANWMVPGKMVKGPGGAMDLVAGVKKVIALMTHITKSGEPKLRKKCHLPLTAKSVVDIAITELGVFKFNKDEEIIKKTGKVELLTKPDDVSIKDILSKTEFEFAY